jgi:hypothetical protein
MMTASEFHAWVAVAGDGEQVEYHRGHLAKDRVGNGDRHQSIDQLATAALKASEAGDVALVQRRHGPADYAYYAVRRSRQSMAVAA